MTAMLTPMSLLHDEALVLDTHPFRDRDQIVSLLARSHGPLRAVLRRARGGKRPLAAATQIMSLVDATLHFGPTAELATIREIHLLKSSYDLARSLPHAAAAAAVAEMLTTFCPPHEPAERAFRLGVALLDALLDGLDPQVAVTYAMLWVLALSGVLPQLDVCAACGAELSGRLVPRRSDGQPLCLGCAGSERDALGGEDIVFLATCRHRPPGEVEEAAPAGARSWLESLVRAEADRPLRALDFFRELERRP